MNFFSAIAAKIYGALLIAAVAFGIWTQLQLIGSRAATRSMMGERDTALADKRVCNASIEAWGGAAKIKEALAGKALADAKGQSTIRIERSNTILKEQPLGEECAATLKLLGKYQ